jgi:hypothetical protein
MIRLQSYTRLVCSTQKSLMELKAQLRRVRLHMCIECGQTNSFVQGRSSLRGEK